MRGLICRCCGEEISRRTEALSRNPNVCASCSSLLDGMDGIYPEQTWREKADGLVTEGPGDERVPASAAVPTPLR